MFSDAAAIEADVQKTKQDVEDIKRKQTRDNAPVHPIDDESENEKVHYHVGKRGSNVLEIRAFMEDNATDPTCKVSTLRRRLYHVSETILELRYAPFESCVRPAKGYRLRR